MKNKEFKVGDEVIFRGKKTVVNWHSKNKDIYNVDDHDFAVKPKDLKHYQPS